MLDARVSGSIPEAETGTLAINISLAVQTLAFSEGLLLAERAGVETSTACRPVSPRRDAGP